MSVDTVVGALRNAVAIDKDGINHIADLLEQIQAENERLKAEKLERENPKPLTLDELIASGGQPLYMKDIDDLPFGYGNKWFICDLDKLPDAFYNYGKTWLAYRHKPDIVNVNKIEHIGEATNMVEHVAQVGEMVEGE